MQHTDAIRSMASEKYLLDELSPALREEFEEHFFDCAECALDVRAGKTFIDQSKIALARDPAVVSRPIAVPTQSQAWWTAWLRPAIAVPVMAMLLLVVGYESFVALPSAHNEVADLRTPHILPSASLMNARSDRIPVVSVRLHQSFLLFVDIPADSRSASYVCELYSPDGKAAWSILVSAEAAKNTLPLQIPSRDLAPGKYNLAISRIAADQSHTEITRYPFELQTQP